MSGPHDIGGRKGFGAIEIRPEEPPLAAPWQGSVVGLAVTTMARGLISVDRWRARQEELHPLAYLELPYFDRWLYSIERNLVLEGVLEEDEIEARLRRLEAGSDEALPRREDPEFEATIEDLIANGAPVVQEADTAPLFAVGDLVRTREIPIARPGEEHTRLPTYAQGKIGRIARLLPGQALPDARVADDEHRPEHTYAVRLRSEDLWADAEPGTSVCFDAWESYLETVPQTEGEETG